jgi:hypothetical protein
MILKKPVSILYKDLRPCQYSRVCNSDITAYTCNGTTEPRLQTAGRLQQGVFIVFLSYKIVIEHRQAQDIQVASIDKPKSWRLVTSRGTAADTEEVILSFQGVIVQKNLPPFLHTA